MELWLRLTAALKSFSMEAALHFHWLGSPVRGEAAVPTLVNSTPVLPSKRRAIARRAAAFLMTFQLGLGSLYPPLAWAEHWSDRFRHLPAGFVIAETLTPQYRAAMALSDMEGINREAVARLLGLERVDQLDSDVRQGRAELARRLRSAIGGAQTTQRRFDSDERAALLDILSDFRAALVPPATAKGTSLEQALRSGQGSRIEIFGLSSSSNIIMPMAMVVPEGTVPGNAPLSVTAPFVLSSDGSSQPMAIGSAHYLYTRPSDNAQVYLLQGYCLDEAVSAPMAAHGYRYISEQQQLLTPALRNRIAQGGDTMQDDIWRLQADSLLRTQ